MLLERVKQVTQVTLLYAKRDFVSVYRKYLDEAISGVETCHFF